MREPTRSTARKAKQFFKSASGNFLMWLALAAGIHAAVFLMIIGATAAPVKNSEPLMPTTTVIQAKHEEKAEFSGTIRVMPTKFETVEIPAPRESTPLESPALSAAAPISEPAGVSIPLAETLDALQMPDDPAPSPAKSVPATAIPEPASFGDTGPVIGVRKPAATERSAATLDPVPSAAESPVAAKDDRKLPRINRLYDADDILTMIERGDMKVIAVSDGRLFAVKDDLKVPTFMRLHNLPSDALSAGVYLPPSAHANFARILATFTRTYGTGGKTALYAHPCGTYALDVFKAVHAAIHSDDVSNLTMTVRFSFKDGVSQVKVVSVSNGNGANLRYEPEARMAGGK